MHALDTSLGSNALVCVLQMAKLTGSSNYKANEIRRLLALVAKYLPLGKDEWERLASHFNANRGRGVSERDYESLRRKFKVLYSTRKPTGVQEMPPHVKEAKLLKKTVDDKANVVIMDDGGDEDDGGYEDEEEEHDKQSDFCFEFDGDESFDHETCTDDRAAVSGTGGDYGISAELTSGSTVTDDSGSDETVGFGTNSIGTSATHLADRGSDFSDLLDSAAVNEGLKVFASTLCPAPVTMRSSPRLRSAGLTKTANTPPVADPRRQTTTTATSSAASADKASSARTRGQEGTCTRDQQEAQRYPGLASSSSRLGGGSLADLRDTVGRKRACEEDEVLIDASYAKAKRAWAAKATTALKQRLSDLKSSANTMGGNIFAMMLMMREENERKAEARRMEEEQRRRDELAAREARYLTGKADAEERPRQE
ncbi:unnamed protein product [Phytophthora fragariaefolia]|uniref:Unnamed protein product n=1 Tax=Phytophthora fragariaefolia TaxID=1490495 RepID=A0A9W6Y004_9STRA|nr:unnamed protein product [Phytophthora fragariaefolia]